MQDHREHARAAVELEVEVEYRGLNRFFADYTKNLSKGGAFVRTFSPLPPGTRVSLRLVLPNLQQPFELEAEVVRAERQGDAGMGLRFVWTDEERRAGFELLVERLMVESLGQRTAAALLRSSRSRQS